VNFKHLEHRFLCELRERVRSGAATERGLARLVGVSQPHMHNVLKGKRFFSLEKADQVLRSLGLDVLDLIDPDEWDRRRPRG
jgi:transcriptional regulator with XRE-family HTH domain